MFAERKRLFFENSVKQLGITFNITAAICALSCFLRKWIWKRSYFFTFVQTQQENEEVSYVEMSCHVTVTRNKTSSFVNVTCHVTMTKKTCIYVKNCGSKIFFQLSTAKKNQIFSTTSFLSCSPLVCNTIVSLDKLTCTNYMDFRKCQDRFGQFSWSKNDFNYLDLKLKVFKIDDNKVFLLAQNLTMETQISTSSCAWDNSSSMH